MKANPYLLKVLVENQLKKTEVPAYFQYGKNKICRIGGQWLVYNENGELYSGYDFDEALDYLFGEKR